MTFGNVVYLGSVTITYDYYRIKLYNKCDSIVFLCFCSGPHRPLWPVYGEYVYLPPQRWLHALEVNITLLHGNVV